MHNFNTFEYRDAVHSAVVNNNATIPRALKQISISFMLFSSDLLGLIQYDLDMLCINPLLVFFSLLHKRLICIVKRILKRSSFPIRGQPCTETMEANRCLGPGDLTPKPFRNPSAVGTKPVDDTTSSSLT